MSKNYFRVISSSNDGDHDVVKRVKKGDSYVINGVRFRALSFQKQRDERDKRIEKICREARFDELKGKVLGLIRRK